MISVFDCVENIVGKEENAGFQHFLLYPECFQRASFSGLLKVVIVWYSVKTHETPPFPPFPKVNLLHTLILSQTRFFLLVCSTSLLKTLWKKEKLLVTSNSSFSHSVFYLLRELSAISIKLSSANSFSLEV